MKTKDLIAALQKEDPTGELECCVGNIDIHFVSQEPAYYDGSLQVLERDMTNQYYNIIGAKFVRSGSKVQIHTLSIEEAILEHPDMLVDCTDDRHGREAPRVEKWREDAKKAIAAADAWFAKLKAEEINKRPES